MRKSLAAAVVAVLLMPAVSQAFNYTTTTAVVTGAGNQAVANMAGTFRLAGGERITNVFVELVDANGRVVATSQGRVDRAAHTWAAGGGHFQAKYYRAMFFVNNPQGTNLQIYRSGLYRLR